MSPLLMRSKEQQRPRFYVQTGSMHENPFGVPLAEIKAMEESLPLEKVAQALYGMYVEASGLVFSNELIMNLVQGEELRVERWMHPDYSFTVGLDKHWKGMRGAQRRRYYAAADLARTNDYTVIFVFDGTNVPSQPASLVYYHRLNRVSWDAIYAEIASVSARFHSEVLLDSTGMGGDVVLDELENRFYCGQCHAAVPYSLTSGSIICPQCRQEGHRVGVAGFNFAGRRKENMITRLQAALSYGQALRSEWGLLRMPHIEHVVDELTFYRLDDKQLETDCVMALGLIAAQLEFEEEGGALGSIHGGE